MSDLHRAIRDSRFSSSLSDREAAVIVQQAFPGIERTEERKRVYYYYSGIAENGPKREGNFVGRVVLTVGILFLQYWTGLS